MSHITLDPSALRVGCCSLTQLLGVGWRSPIGGRCRPAGSLSGEGTRHIPRLQAATAQPSEPLLVHACGRDRGVGAAPPPACTSEHDGLCR